LGQAFRTRFQIFTQVILEHPQGRPADQIAATFQGTGHRFPQALEYQAVHHGVHHAAHHRSHTGKRLENIADQRQQQIDAPFDLTARQIQESLHVHFPRRHLVQRAQFLDEADSQIALNEHIGPRTDRRQGSEHRLARIALDDSLGFFPTMPSDRRIEFLLGQDEYRRVAQRI